MATNKSSSLINPQSYQKLLSSLHKILLAGKKATAQIRTLTKWQLGRNVHQDILKNKDRAGYGEHLYSLLAKDLDTTADDISRAVQFYRKYPILATSPKLSWSHVRDLLRIENPVERKLLEVKVVKENISVSSLRKIIQHKNKAKALDAKSEPIPVLKVTCGLLFTYKIINVPKATQSPGFSLVVDCGFHQIYPLSNAQLTNFSDGQLVESHPKGTGYQIVKTTRKESDLYTYKAYLQRVVDGDTIWVFVDCGFEKRWVHRKLRFKGIDVPELNTPEGKRAKQFIVDTLALCEFIIIKTYVDDKYARPLVDVFFMPGEADAAKVAAHGRYLNQELLDQGFAKVWK